MVMHVPVKSLWIPYTDIVAAKHIDLLAYCDHTIGMVLWMG